MANYSWPPPPPPEPESEAGSIPSQYGKEPDIVFDPEDWIIQPGPFDAGTINDMVVAIEDLADAVNLIGAEVLADSFDPIVININGSSSISYPPNYNPAYGDGVRANMQQYVGDSWDGSTSGVTMITSWNRYGYGSSSPVEGVPGWDGDIGPGSLYPMRGNTWSLPLPHNGEVYSAKYTFDRSVNGAIRFNMVPPSSGYNWQSNGYLVLFWMSSTPGGNPHMDYHGNPHMFTFGVDRVENFGTYYDRDLISVGQGLSPTEGFRTTFIGAEALRRDLTNTGYGGRTGGDYIFPVIKKTYFLNWAMIRATAASGILTRATPPTASERKNLTGMSGQQVVVSQNGDYDLTTPHFYTLNNYLEKTRYKIADSHRGYIGLDETMADFMWDSESSFLSDSAYTPIGSSDISLTTTDIGFEGGNPLLFPDYEYAIPQDGKLSSIEFTMAYGGPIPDAPASTTFDHRNSTFDVAWTPHGNNTTRAWYDLGLTPVMWMSAEPGGEPQPTYDKSKGVVIAIPARGAIYEGQQILSTSEVSSLGPQSETKATFPITNHKYYINVGVVETAVATQLEETGVAPTASQLQAWSPTDPSIDYTANENQIMYLNRSRIGLNIFGVES